LEGLKLTSKILILYFVDTSNTGSVGVFRLLASKGTYENIVSVEFDVSTKNIVLSK